MAFLLIYRHFNITCMCPRREPYGQGHCSWGWKRSHTAFDKNVDGSSKAMEAEAVRRIWTISLEKYAFWYTTILSDGDASTFAALTQLEPYGPEHVIVKLDCLNHAEKRMGTALRKASKIGWAR